MIIDTIIIPTKSEIIKDIICKTFGVSIVFSFNSISPLFIMTKSFILSSDDYGSKKDTENPIKVNNSIVSNNPNNTNNPPLHE